MDLTVVIRREGDREERCLTLQGVEQLTGIPVLLIRRMVRQGLIAPVSDEPLFSQETLTRILKIERLRSHLDLSLSATGVVIKLLDRLEEIEQDLARLRFERSRRDAPEGR